MLELVFTVCLIAASGPTSACHEEVLLISDEAGLPLKCQLIAQPMLAEWTNWHPKWRVMRYGCRPRGRERGA